MRSFAVFVTLMYLWSQAFDSVIRWVLNMAHADPAIYLRDFGLVCVAVTCFFLMARNGTNITRSLLLAVSFAMLTCVSLCSELNLVQTLFGIKVWLPLVIGILMVEAQITNDLDR